LKVKKGTGIVAEQSFCFFIVFFSPINFLEEGYRFLPFIMKGKIILKIMPVPLNSE
jgi:hypothetical protein